MHAARNTAVWFDLQASADGDNIVVNRRRDINNEQAILKHAAR